MTEVQRYRTKVIYRNPTDGEVKESEIDVVDAMDHERAIASLNAQWIARINALALMKFLQDREQGWDQILEPEEVGAPCPDYLGIEVTVGDLRELRKLTEVKS